MEEIVLYIHLVTIVPCIFLGMIIFLSSKEMPIHYVLGRTYITFFFITTVCILLLPSKSETALFGHFGLFHIIVLLIVGVILTAIRSIQRGHIKSHKIKMIIAYIFLLIGSFLANFTPGRPVYTLIQEVFQ